MGKRATGRKLAMQALYQIESRNDSRDLILEQFLEQSRYDSETIEWAVYLTRSTWDHRHNLDDIIKEYAIDWEINRITPIDKNILRIALFELKYTDTPINVVLNEAIEISKKYSTEESPKFINGILGNYVKKECSPD